MYYVYKITVEHSNYRHQTTLVRQMWPCAARLPLRSRISSFLEGAAMETCTNWTVVCGLKKEKERLGAVPVMQLDTGVLEEKDY